MPQLINDENLSAFSFHTATWKYHKIKSGYKVRDDEIKLIINKYLNLLKDKNIIKEYNSDDFDKLFWFTNNMNKESIIINLGNQKYSYKDFEKFLNIK